MAAGSSSHVLRCLRRVALRDPDALADGPLVDAFVARRDEAAFAALVRRHGPMVWGVCRRVVGHTQDAEDAFQAAFLVLARKAATVRPREQVGSWLYGVACRVAMKAKSISLRRRAKEKQVTAMPHPSADPPEAVDWQPLLDRELAQLPDKYRVPIVLCDLEGRTRREVARQLQLPDGTLSNRLAAGRRMLAGRLARHGVTLSGGALAAALATEVRAVPVRLAATAAKLATSPAIPAPVLLLTEGVLKAMLMNKLKTTTAALALAVIAITALSVTALPTPTAAADTPPVAASPAKPPDRPITDRDRLQGTWGMIAGTADGAKIPPEYIKEGRKWLFAGDRLLMLRGDQPGRHEEASYRIEPTRQPKTLDRVPADGPDKGRIHPGLYTFLNEFLIVADNPKTKERPGSLHAGQGRVLVFRHEDSSPGPALADEEFLRRACQALRGVAMTHLEKTYFLADKDANKRAKVLDWLTGPAQTAWFEQGYFRLTNQPQFWGSSNLTGWQLGLDDTYSNTLYLNQFGHLLGGRANLNTVDPLTYHQLGFYLPARPLIAAQLNTINPSFIELAAGPGGDDAEYLRRAMLDMFGVIPTVLESKYFLADKDPKKREKVVQWLAQAPEYKQRSLDRLIWQNLARQALPPGVSCDLNRYVTIAPAAGPDRLDQLLTQLLAEKKSDEQTLEALYLATMARYPTDDAKRVILAQVGKQNDRAAAWKDVLHSLTQSKDARDYADALKRRAGQPK